MQTYQRKPSTVQAVQLTQAAADAGQIPDGVTLHLAGPTHPRLAEGMLEYAVVPTPIGDCTAFLGDWLVAVDGSDSVFRVFRPEAFADRYTISE